jgi:hypothetical protein
MELVYKNLSSYIEPTCIRPMISITKKENKKVAQVVIPDWPGWSEVKKYNRRQENITYIYNWGTTAPPEPLAFLFLEDMPIYLCLLLTFPQTRIPDLNIKILIAKYKDFVRKVCGGPSTLCLSRFQSENPKYRLTVDLPECDEFICLALLPFLFPKECRQWVSFLESFKPWTIQIGTRR